MHSVLTCVNEICFIGTGSIREKSGKTALPVGSEGSADNCIQNPQAVEKKLDGYIRPIIQVIESIPIHDLLVKMQRERVHMAILVDEYGGTAGLVTVEDIFGGNCR